LATKKALPTSRVNVDYNQRAEPVGLRGHSMMTWPIAFLVILGA